MRSYKPSRREIATFATLFCAKRAKFFSRVSRKNIFTFIAFAHLTCVEFSPQCSRDNIVCVRLFQIILDVILISCIIILINTLLFFNINFVEFFLENCLKFILSRINYESVIIKCNITND